MNIQLDKYIEEEDKINDYLNNIEIEDIIDNLPGINWCQFRVSLTQLCNESCFFCHNEWNPKEKVKFDDKIFKKSIDIMSKYWIKQRIRFTWWEPTLYDWLPDLIKYTKSKLPESSVWMTTNWLLLNEQAEALIKAWLDKITVSLHSLNQKLYNDITKVNWLEKVLKWLEKLKELWFKWEISINSVIWTYNIDEVSHLDTFCTTNWYKLKLLDILPTENSFKKYVLTQRQIEEITKLNNTKWERTQEKCLSCSKKEICWWEAEYLRMSPDWILNPCLELKKFDIDLKNIELDSINFEKWFLLWLRRIKDLSL